MASTTLPFAEKPPSSELDGEAAGEKLPLSAPPSDYLVPESNSAPEPTPTAPAASQEDEWVTGIKLLNIVAALTLVCLLLLLDSSIISTVETNFPQLVAEAKSLQAIPRITSDFHSLRDIGWYGGAYQLGRCVVLIYVAD